MATLKEVKTKIAGVKKTKQITKAMNMVAASKLRGAQSKMESFRPYAGKFAEVLGSLAGSAAEDASPLLVPRDEVKKINVVLCTSDRGLCGGFNANLLDKAARFQKAKAAEGIEVSFTAFGKKGRDWCKKSNFPIVDAYVGIVGGTFDFSIATASGRKLIKAFEDGEFDEVHVIYSEFIGMARQIPVVRQLLPIPPLAKEPDFEEIEEIGKESHVEHICEPSADALMGELLPKNICIQIYSGLLETSTSEHAARMAAMDNASKACDDMIGNLTLAYNKARQAAITAELMDIVGGAEALKG